MSATQPAQSGPSDTNQPLQPTAETAEPGRGKLTDTGRLVLYGSVLLAAAGRLFGMLELLLLGVAGVALALAALMWVRTRNVRLTALRTVYPQQVHVGGECTVLLQVGNPQQRPTPVLRLQDMVGGAAAVHRLLAPLQPGQHTRLQAPLPTDRRGRFVVGPVQVTVRDPLWLARRTLLAGGRSDVLVLPAVVPLAPPPLVSGGNVSLDATIHNYPASSGNEPLMLRPFQQGDDMRRVHWPSSAHHDQLMVRQDESSSLSASTVLLDTRLSPGTNPRGSGAPQDPVFEAMVSAAVSICEAARARGDHIRLCTTGGYDSGSGFQREHLRAILEHLAVAQPDSSDLAAGVNLLANTAADGPVVAVVRLQDGSEADVLSSVATRFSSATVVLFAAGPFTSGSTVTVVRVEHPEDFAAAWAMQVGAVPTSHAKAGRL